MRPSLPGRAGCRTFRPSTIRMSGRRTVSHAAGDDVVDEVRVDGGRHLVLARLDVRDEAGQRPAVVRLREALPRHQAAGLELLGGQQEAVRGDQLHARVLGPAGQQGLEKARDGGFADGDRARDAYHERRTGLGALLAEERVQGAAQAVGRAHVEVEEPGERQIDVPHLVEVDDIAQAAQLLHLLGGQRQRRLLTQRAPFRAGEVEVGSRLRPGPVGAPRQRGDR